MEVILHSPKQALDVLKGIYDKAVPYLTDGNKLKLTVEADKRSNAQNDLMWGLLTDLSNQVTWHGVKLSPTDWKHMVTASLKKQRIFPGIDGNMVVLGSSTSKMTKQEMTDVIEATVAFGLEQGVEFRDF